MYRSEKQQQGQHRIADVPLSFSSCKLTTADLMACNELYAANGMSDGVLQARRLASSTAPTPIASGVIHELKQWPVWKAPRDVVPPAWMAKLCCHRNVFQGCALELNTAGAGSHVYLIMFCRQDYPLHASFSVLEEVFPRKPCAVVTSENWEELVMECQWRRMFKVSFLDHTPWYELPLGTCTGMYLLRGMQYLEGGRVGTTMPEESFDGVLNRLKMPERADRKPTEREDRPRGDTAWQNELLRRAPWMRGSLDEEEAVGTATGTTASTGLPLEGEVEAELTDEDYARALVELHEARGEEVLLRDGEIVDFVVKPLGGRWTRENKGVAVDSYRGEAVPAGSDAEQWARQYNMGASATFAIALYGNSGARTLAATWCMKCQHFYDMYERHGGGTHTYSEADVATWRDPADFLEFMHESNGRALTRCRWLRDLRPRKS
jgi:hypothetical protein